jgi:hypothetical protein
VQRRASIAEVQAAAEEGCSRNKPRTFSSSSSSPLDPCGTAGATEQVGVRRAALCRSPPHPALPRLCSPSSRAGLACQPPLHLPEAGPSSAAPVTTQNPGHAHPLPRPHQRRLLQVVHIKVQAGLQLIMRLWHRRQPARHLDLYGPPVGHLAQRHCAGGARGPGQDQAPGLWAARCRHEPLPAGCRPCARSAGTRGSAAAPPPTLLPTLRAARLLLLLLLLLLVQVPVRAQLEHQVQRVAEQQDDALEPAQRQLALLAHLRQAERAGTRRVEPPRAGQRGAGWSRRWRCRGTLSAGPPGSGAGSPGSGSGGGAPPRCVSPTAATAAAPRRWPG